MEIKLSQVPEYIDHMIKRRTGKYDESERLLNICIDMARVADDKLTLTHLLRCMGDLYFEKGERVTALNYYLEAEKIDENYYGTKYYSAAFMADRLKDYRLAIEKCDEVIQAAEEPQSDADARKYGDIRYTVAQCHALQGYCHIQLGDIEQAGESLSHLQELLGYNHNEYDFKLCEALIRQGSFVEEAKEHLRKLKSFLAEGDEDEYDAKNTARFINEIDKLLST